MDFFNKLSIRTKIVSVIFVAILIFVILIALQFDRIVYSENQLVSLHNTERASKTVQKLAIMNKNERLLLLEMTTCDELQTVQKLFEKHAFMLDNSKAIYDSAFYYIEQIYEDKNNLALVGMVNSLQGAYSETNDFLKLYFSNAYKIKKSQLIEGDNLLNIDSVRITEDSVQTQSAIVPIEVNAFEGTTRSAQLVNLYRAYKRKSSEIDDDYDEILKSLHNEHASRDTEVISVGNIMKTNNGIFLIVTFLSFLLIFLFLAKVISTPLRKLEKITLKLAEGELPDEIEAFTTKDEIGRMSRALSLLSDGLKKTSEFALEVGRRNFSSQFRPLSDKDVLGNVLLDMRKSLQLASKEENKRKLEDKERAWTTGGLALFGDILRKHTENLTLLSRDIITNLVKYLNVNQGGIFILNDSNPEDVFLELASAYAYGREKFIQKRIRPGEGLVGGVALEKYTVYMTELPEDYMDIESGLGGANPKSLLIVPLKLEDDVLGVIELASFKEMKKHEIKLVERIAESIASTLSTARINTTTAELLEQSRVREQERQEHENEMKKNIAVMKASQRELIKKDREMSQEVKELETIRQDLLEQRNKQNKRLENLTLENKKCRSDLQTLSSQITQIFEVDILPIIVIDEHVKIEVFNNGAEEITGYNKSELIGRNLNAIFDKKAADEISNQITLFFETKQLSLIDREFMFDIISKSKEKVPVKFKMREILIRDHKHIVMFINNMGIIQDLKNQRDAINETLMSKEFDYSIRINSLEHFINKNGLIIPIDLEASTDLMRWNITHSIGLNVIDNQHRRWIEFINVLYKAYKMKSKKDVIVEHIDKLLDYSDYHFGFEEKYMEDFKCNVLEQHVASHRHFVDTIRTLRSKYKQGDKRALYKLIILLHNLTALHIEESREYVPCFKKNGFS